MATLSDCLPNSPAIFVVSRHPMVMYRQQYPPMLRSQNNFHPQMYEQHVLNENLKLKVGLNQVFLLLLLKRWRVALVLWLEFAHFYQWYNFAYVFFRFRIFFIAKLEMAKHFCGQNKIFDLFLFEEFKFHVNLVHINMNINHFHLPNLLIIIKFSSALTDRSTHSETRIRWYFPVRAKIGQFIKHRKPSNHKTSFIQ